MSNWRIMIEIIWHSIEYSYTCNINNREFNVWFVAIANVQLRSIRCYKKCRIKTWQFGLCSIQGYNKFLIKTWQLGWSVLTGWANILKRTIRAIEKSWYWQISDEGRFGAISNAQDHTQLKSHVQQRPIQIPSDIKVTHRKDE